jgi:glycosyltransferase involved in cell wall biosynthesis
MTVSIIIAARNNSEYLDETIRSCLNQTVSPLEIIYSDDFSTDNSLDIVNKYNKEIVILRHNKHVGVVQARNDGADVAKGDTLMFVDGDDTLPFDFIEKHLEVYDSTTPFVYGAANAFGLFNTLWKVFSWKTLFIWNRNFVNTSALMNKEVFIRAGKWKETCVNTMWDWHLVLRMSRFGLPRKSSAILNYRQHEGSWSTHKEKKNNNSDFLTLTEAIRKEVVTISIGLIYSGRVGDILYKWLDKLVDDIHILYNKPQLVIINNTSTNLTTILKAYKKHFSEIKVLTGEGKLVWKDEIDRRNKVSELLSDQYNRILENATGEIIHLREDDIIPNNKSFELLYNFITEGNPVKEAVAGIYLNRNPNYKRIVGGYYNNSNPKNTTDLIDAPSIKPFKVDFTGTGFLMFWKELCPTFSPYIDNIQAHDWAWGKKLKAQKGELWIIPEATCKHYTTEKEYVEYKKEFEINAINTFTKTIDKSVSTENPCVIIKRKCNV